MEAKVEIAPGICLFDTAVTARTDDGQNVTFEIETECATMREFAEKLAELGPVDAYQELRPDVESAILAAARPLLMPKGCCEACVVPAGVCKAMQVAANLALPKDVSMRIVQG